jgi:4-hydroxy-3-methylbut-2-enyl diphosphate reductase
MPNIILAKTAGFCWGVKRAIDIATEAGEQKSEPVYTYGPLIHNPQLINLLESKNIHVKSDIKDMEGGELIIRTHGITPQQRALIRGKGISIRDATCPLVAKVQGMIKKFSRKGYAIIIVGSKEHAEVIGLKGFAVTPVHVITSPKEADLLPNNYEKVFVCAQTTCSIENYRDSVKRLREIYKNIEVGETICDATTERQTEVIELAKEVDALIVVGGKESANTARLVSIGKEKGLPTWHVETEAELDIEALKEFDTIGVTAGASTPKWVIDDVLVKLSQIDSPRYRKLFSPATALGFLVKSEIYLSFGAIAMTYVNMKVMNVAWSVALLAISFCAILSTYLLNQILRPEELKRSNSRKYVYHIKYRMFFRYIATISAVVGAILSFGQGGQILGIYLLLVLFGSSYGINRPFFQKVLGQLSKLKNIPASKDLFVGLAWGIVTVAIPFIATGTGKYFILPFVFTFGIGYVRAVLLDLQDIYSDRIMGKEVLPMLMGSKGAIFALYGVLILETAFILVKVASGAEIRGVIPYFVGIFYLFGFIFYHQTSTPTTRFNFFLDTSYFAMACAALILS